MSVSASEGTEYVQFASDEEATKMTGGTGVVYEGRKKRGVQTTLFVVLAVPFLATVTAIASPFLGW
jgi:hypothetical protein